MIKTIYKLVIMIAIVMSVTPVAAEETTWKRVNHLLVLMAGETPTGYTICETHNPGDEKYMMLDPDGRVYKCGLLFLCKDMAEARFQDDLDFLRGE